MASAYTPGEVLTAAALNASFDSKTSNNAAAITGGTVEGLDHLYVAGLDPSNSPATGALTVAGGAGIGGDAYVGGSLNVITAAIVQATTNSTSPSTGALVVFGGVGIGANLFVGGAITAAGALTATHGVFNDATQSSSPTTGAVTVSGGAGIAKNLSVGQQINGGGDLSIQGKGTVQGTLTGGALTISPGGVLTFADGSVQTIAAVAGGVWVDATAPTDPITYPFWFNTTNSTLYVWSAGAWVQSSPGGGAVWVDTTPPTRLDVYVMWYDTVNLILYVYYNDGNTSQWVGIGGAGVGLQDAPTDGQAYVRKNAAWSVAFNAAGQLVTADGAVATPSISFQTQTGLGFYKPAPDIIAIAAEGATGVRFDLSVATSAWASVAPKTAGGTVGVGFVATNAPFGAANYQQAQLSINNTGVVLGSYAAGSASRLNLTLDAPNVTAAGNLIGTGGVFAVNTNFGMYPISGYNLLQFSGNWYYRWNTSNGTIEWIGNGVSRWNLDGNGNSNQSGSASFGGRVLVNSGGVNVTGVSAITTSGAQYCLALNDAGGNGAGIVFSGANGAKFMRVNPNPGAVFEMLNNAFNTVIMAVTDGGTIQANTGYQCKNGSLGGFGPNTFNWFYSGGQNYSFIDNTNIGYVTLNSDERIKKNIEPLVLDMDDFAKIETFIYEYNGKHPLFPADGKKRWGFTVQNLLAAGFPMATDGDVAEMDATGEIQPARIDTTVLLAMLYNVVLRQEARIKILEGAK